MIDVYDCYASSKLDAIYRHYFLSRKTSLENTELDWPEVNVLEDTDINYPVHQRSGYYLSGPWGPAKFGGTRWPKRYVLRTRD